jgi:hypothetical protein
VKRPAFQFYPADWRKDMALQSCSVSARGLWMDMLCIAHECEPYGYLTVNGKPMTAAQIGRHTGLTEREATKLLAELADAGVSSVNEEGVIFSRRMVRDEDLRNRRAEGGKAGSSHGIKGAEHGKKGGRPARSRGVSEPPLEPPPSSSSSATAIPSDADASGGTPPPPATVAPAKQAAAEPKDVVFGLGVPLLTGAGVAEKNARSFLAMNAKHHGDKAVAEALNRCANERPVEPISWLQAALGPIKPCATKASKHSGFESKNYHDGVTADGHLA